MNRSDIVVAKGRNELLVVYEVSQAGLVTCGVWLGHGVLSSEHRPEDLETVARPTGCPVHLGGVVWHARLHSLIHAEMIEGDRVEGPVLNPGKPGRYNVPIEEVAAMAASHWLFWAAAPAGHTYSGAWFPVSHFSPIRVPIAGPYWAPIDVPVPKPYVSPFKVGDRVVCNDGKILGTVEAIECDAMHSILVREDSGDAEHWLPEAFRLATWHDEKPFL